MYKHETAPPTYTPMHAPPPQSSTRMNPKLARPHTQARLLPELRHGGHQHQQGVPGHQLPPHDSARVVQPALLPRDDLQPGPGRRRQGVLQIPAQLWCVAPLVRALLLGNLLSPHAVSFHGEEFGNLL